MKKKIVVLFILLFTMVLNGCSALDLDSAPTDAATPNRMVTHLDIATNPVDEEDARSYSDQEIISSVLRMLRDLDTTDYPKQSPILNDEKAYYTITATYANGGSKVYYILEKQYLRFDDEPWCIIDKTKAVELLRYIEDTPSN